MPGELISEGVIRHNIAGANRIYRENPDTAARMIAKQSASSQQPAQPASSSFQPFSGTGRRL